MKEQKKKAGKVTRREFLYLTGAGVAGMTLAGMPKFSYAQKPKYGGRVRIACRYGASGLDVHRNMDYADYKWYSLMSEGLTEQGPLPQVYQHPCLAKSWEVSQDGRVFVFPLKEGVKFHDGSELTAEAVQFSIERLLSLGQGASSLFSLVIKKGTTRVRPGYQHPSGWNCTPVPEQQTPASATGPGPIPGSVPSRAPGRSRGRGNSKGRRRAAGRLLPVGRASSRTG